MQLPVMFTICGSIARLPIVVAGAPALFALPPCTMMPAADREVVIMLLVMFAFDTCDAVPAEPRTTFRRMPEPCDVALDVSW